MNDCIDCCVQIEILSLLKGHPHVVQLEGVYEDGTSVHLVMELCIGGPLTDHIANHVRTREFMTVMRSKH